MSGKLRAIPFETWHLDMIDITKDQVFSVAKSGFRKELALMPYNYVLGSCIYDGRIIMIGGITKLWDGVGEFWAFISKSFCDVPLKEFVKVSRQMLIDVENKESFHRIQATVIDEEKKLKFVKLFGFEVEGPLRKFNSSGDDHWMVSRIR